MMSVRMLNKYSLTTEGGLVCTTYCRVLTQRYLDVLNVYNISDGKKGSLLQSKSHSNTRTWKL